MELRQYASYGLRLDRDLMRAHLPTWEEELLLERGDTEYMSVDVSGPSFTLEWFELPFCLPSGPFPLFC